MHGHAFLGLDSLMQSLAVPPANHHSPSELVNYDHLAVLDEIIVITLVKHVGAQSIVQIRGLLPVLWPVQVVYAVNPLDFLHARFRQCYHACLLVNAVVTVWRFGFHTGMTAGLELAYNTGKLPIQTAALLGGARDDEGRTCLVNEDVVYLVNDRVVELSLAQLAQIEDHVVAQVIESELVVRAVGDVAVVRLATGDRSKIKVTVIRCLEVWIKRVRPFVGMSTACRLDHTHRHPE